AAPRRDRLRRPRRDLPRDERRPLGRRRVDGLARRRHRLPLRPRRLARRGRGPLHAAPGGHALNRPLRLTALAALTLLVAAPAYAQVSTPTPGPWAPVKYIAGDDDGTLGAAVAMD